MNKVVVAVPSGDMMHSDCAVSLAYLFQKSETPIVGLLNYRTSVLPQSRNESVKIAIKAQATHILFLDSDLNFPPTTLDRLIAHKAPIVGASYCTRDAREMRIGIPLDQGDCAPLRRMKAIAMGCLLIDLKVFNTLKKPWFNFIYQGEDFFDEGFYFCAAAQEAGYMLWEDQTLSFDLAHVGIKHFKIKHQPN